MVLEINEKEARLLANLLYEERDGLENCGCSDCTKVLPESDRLWNELRFYHKPYVLGVDY